MKCFIAICAGILVGLSVVGRTQAQPVTNCPDDVLISNYQTTTPQFIEVANVGIGPISLGGCSVVTFNVLTETSIGSATEGLTGTLSPGQTTQVAISGAPPLGAIGLYDAPPPANGTPFSTENEITGMVYLSNETVFGIGHLKVPDHNEIYDCIYGETLPPGNFPRMPLEECFNGIPPPAPVITPPLIEGDMTVIGVGVPDAMSEVFADGSSVATGTVGPDGNFSVDVPALVAGQEVTAAQTVDGLTSVRSAPVVVGMRPEPLAIEIVSPEDGSVFSSSPIAVAGTVSDDMATVEVNGNGATVNSGGAWTASVPLAEGSNLIVASATDSAGNSATDSIQVTLETAPTDIDPPTLTIDNPISEAFVTQSQATVEVSYSDASGVDTGSLGFSANGVSLPVDCDSSENSASCVPSSALPLGPVLLEASVADVLGNTATAQVEFIADTPVEITIASPVEGIITNEAQIEVTGEIGADVASVTVNGVTAGVGNSFSATVPLREGPNMIVAVAAKANGNTGTDSVFITKDTTAPNIQINSPPSGFRTIVNRVAVTGVVNDFVTGGVDPRVQVNGIEAFVQQGTFMAMDVPLVRGPNNIVAIAVDAVGNEDTAEINVSFDPPAGNKLAPVSGDGQVGLVGTTLPEPLVARVVDNAGNALASRVVRFDVLRGSGSLATESGRVGRSVEVPTDGAGLARVNLTLGDRSGEGNNQVLASSVGASGQAIFCATAQPALPDKILAVMGENQKGLVGNPLPGPFEVLVVDRAGNPVAGVSVTYSVVSGGGKLDGLATKTVTTDANGVGWAVLTLGTAEGINNNIVEATFPDNQGLPATFISSGLVGGPPEDTRFAGVVLDNTNTPIPGATVHIGGSNGHVLTDEEGQFLVEGVPVGSIHLEIDPSTSSRPETFPHLAFEATTVAGRINRLPTGPIRIPPLVSDAQVVGGDEDVVLQMPGVPGLTLTVFAKSATFQDGSTTGLASINQVHLDKVPMLPPGGATFIPPAWTVQPPGVFFDPPARVTIPNNGLPPGRVIDLFQFDHDVNRFVNIGPGTVDEAGLLIVSDPGFGITKAGWGGGTPPPPPTTCTPSCSPRRMGICTTTRFTLNVISTRPCRFSCIPQTQNKADGTPCPNDTDICTNDICVTGDCTHPALSGAAKAAINAATDPLDCPNRGPRAGHTAGSNGCTAVPDNPNICAPAFTPACNAHDRCFDTCNSGKGNCDAAFGRDLDAICAGVTNAFCRTDCQINAGTYTRVTSAMPAFAFYNPAQRNACQCCP